MSGIVFPPEGTLLNGKSTSMKTNLLRRMVYSCQEFFIIKGGELV